jgi:hypothetical protein
MQALVVQGEHLQAGWALPLLEGVAAEAETCAPELALPAGVHLASEAAP